MNPNEQQPAETVVPMPTPTATPIANAQPATNESNILVMNILAYMSILVLIPLFMAKDNPKVKFHIKQGLVLFIGYVIIYVVGNMSYGMTFGLLAPVISIVNIALLVLSIIGIINVIKREEKELPLVGSLAKHLPI
ncbi:hypothetical protein K2Q16_00885 [Patescibacteria group bacterium]|nr:hypothetical protein [Patescibacteria group bacterium]